MPRIFIVTGEASGDLHGAHLATALRRLRPEVQLSGVGGPRMAAAGVDLLPVVDRLDIVGLFGLGQLRAIWRTFTTIARYLRRTPLDAVVFIDHPGMNLRLARVAAWVGRRVVYYIAPQIWAWGSVRLRIIRRVVDRVIVVLPFEEPLYRRAGVPCTFVGHPLLDEVAPSYDRAGLRKRFALDESSIVIGLLPGSRVREVRSLLPLMRTAAERLASDSGRVQFILAQAGSVPDDVLAEMLTGTQAPIRVIKDQANEVMAAADLLFVASGTATLQAAVVGTPMVIVYKVGATTYWIGQLVRQLNGIRLFHHLGCCIGLVNLVAGARIVPELLQHEARVDRLLAEAKRLWPGTPAAAEMRRALRAVRDALGEPGGSRRAAEAVLAECPP